jgi:hypothetical protein
MSLVLLLSGLAQAAPDFQITWINAECHPVTGVPWVQMGIINLGDVPEVTSIDLFIGLPLAPSPGDMSDRWRYSRTLSPGVEDVYDVQIPEAPRADYVWLDVLLDTLDEVVEDDEGNNHAEFRAKFSSCL